MADVLLKSKAEQQQYDFIGQLSFSWPKSPYQTSLNQGDQGYAPLLPFGFGLRYGQLSILPNTLNEQVASLPDADNEMAIFKRATLPPWQASIASSKITMAINSSTAQLENISFRTLDRFVQEDTISLKFLGEQASYVVANPFSEDLRDFAQSDASLVLELQVNEPPKGKVFVEMNCEGDCAAQVDITAFLSSKPQDKWWSLAIPLSCFSAQGLDMSKVTVPFKLSSNREFTVKIHQIAIKPVNESISKVSCGHAE